MFNINKFNHILLIIIMSNQNKFIDLFCGIGGFHQAFIKMNNDNANNDNHVTFECVMASDSNRACKDTYLKNYSTNHHNPIDFKDDVKTLAKEISDLGSQFDKTKGPIKEFDIICGGFPCQPFSNSGKKKAFEDTRGTLFHDIMTIAKAYQPRFMFLENVKHIKKVDSGKVFTTILKCLEEEGYVVYVNELSPHQLGIPQQRERIIFSCIRKDIWLQQDGNTENKMNEVCGTSFNIILPTITSCDLTNVINNIGANTDDHGYLKKNYIIDSELRQVLDAWDTMIAKMDTGEKLSPTILIKDLDIEYFETEIKDGNIVVKMEIVNVPVKNKDGTLVKNEQGEPIEKKVNYPILKTQYREKYNSFPEWRKDYILKNKPLYYKYKGHWDKWLSMYRNNDIDVKDDDIRNILNRKEIYSKLEWQTGPKKENDSIWNYFINMRQSGIRVKKTHYFPTLVAIVQTPIYGKEKRRITPRECARLQSFPDSFKCHSKDHTAYKQFGNAVNVEVVYTVMKQIFNIYH